MWGGGGHGRNQMGDRGSRLPPENSQKIGFLSYAGPDPLKKSQNYQASIQCWTNIGPPAKAHLNSFSLAGRRWPIYSDIWILYPLIS